MIKVLREAFSDTKNLKILSDEELGSYVVDTVYNIVNNAGIGSKLYDDTYEYRLVEGYNSFEIEEMVVTRHDTVFTFHSISDDLTSFEDGALVKLNKRELREQLFEVVDQLFGQYF